ncbi:MAG: insulinase family protein [Gemmatimonadales bacterium]|nr:insulinase family protein [Gemmatimonadales bacterium]
MVQFQLACAAILSASLVTPSALAQQSKQPAGPRSNFHVPVDYHTLANGLRVVLSPDHTSPTVVVAAYYNVGFRLEPRGRTGFAHLFEHLMFQGSPNLPKGHFDRIIEGNGGIGNGSTRFDYTNYFEVVPSHMLETILWGEADRMRGPALTDAALKNQQDVVKNEVKVNVLNQPYGGFPWLDLPMRAFTNWANAHNFYGDFTDLDAATTQEAQEFFRTYYAPSNAVLVVTGDFDPAAVLPFIRRQFESIPSTPRPTTPDVTEPKQERERRFTKEDSLATRPALAIAYQMPERNTPEYFAMGLLDQILIQGEDSRLHQALVQRNQLTGEVSGGINLGESMFAYSGPNLFFASIFHDADKPPERIVAVVDSVVRDLQERPVDPATFERALVKRRSQLFDEMGEFFGFGRANLLASFALFDGDPGRINTIDREFARLTPALLKKTAREFLRPTNRTVLLVIPKGAPARASQP